MPVAARMNSLPSATSGHFVLESGLHTDRWFDLETLFCDTRAAAQLADRLVALLEPFACEAVCGPLVGGALLAQLVAVRMDIDFLYAVRTHGDERGVHRARYALPPAQRCRAAGRRVAIVDDMISAASSTRATHDALRTDGARVVAVGTSFLMGTVGARRLAAFGVPLVAAERHPLDLWTSDACPYCADGVPPTSAGD